MKPLYRAVIALAPLTALAAEPAPSTSALLTPQQMLAVLRTQQPGTQFDSVTASEIPGVFEVVMGKNIAYVGASGRYWLFGHIYDVQTRRDLTQARMPATDFVDVKSLPLELAVKSVSGKSKRTLYVFADPNCGYCKRFERELASVPDLTIYTFMVPILGPDSVAKSQAIWCAPSPLTAWRAWMLDGISPPAPSQACSTRSPGNQLLEFARSNHIDGTPTLVSSDGRMKAGAMPANEITAWLDQAGQKRSDATVASKP